MAHVDAPDDEMVEAHEPKADVGPSKKRAARTVKAPMKEKTVEEDDSDDEPVIIKKARGPARKAVVASEKAPAKTIVTATPASGTFMYHEIMIKAYSLT